jgi:hypothetical protein
VSFHASTGLLVAVDARRDTLFGGRRWQGFELWRRRAHLARSLLFEGGLPLEEEQLRLEHCIQKVVSRFAEG